MTLKFTDYYILFVNSLTHKPGFNQQKLYGLYFVYRYVIAGHSYSSLSFYFRVGLPTIHEIVKETTKALHNFIKKTAKHEKCYIDT